MNDHAMEAVTFKIHSDDHVCKEIVLISSMEK